MKQELLHELDIRFSSLGFNRLSDRFYGESYSRSMPGGRQSISLVMHPRGNSLEIYEPSISIRLDAIENLVARIDDRHPLVAETDIASRSTLGLAWAQNSVLTTLFKGPRRLRKPEDVVRAANQIVSSATEFGNPFWKQFADMAEVLKVLANEDESSSKYSSGTDVIRAKKAIAAGLLLGGLSKAREISNAKVATLAQRNLNKSASEIKRWVDKALALGQP